MELDQEPSEPNEHVLSPGQPEEQKPEEGDEEEDEKKDDFEHIPGHCSFCMEPASSQFRCCGGQAHIKCWEEH